MFNMTDEKKAIEELLAKSIGGFIAGIAISVLGTRYIIYPLLLKMAHYIDDKVNNQISQLLYSIFWSGERGLIINGDSLKLPVIVISGLIGLFIFLSFLDDIDDIIRKTLSKYKQS